MSKTTPSETTDLSESKSRSENDIVQFADEENISESVENLDNLKDRIAEARSQRINTQSKTADDSQNKIPKHRTGVIVPKPEEKENVSTTGEIEKGKIVVWVRDESTGEYFKQLVQHPDTGHEYNENNEYIRLCSSANVNTKDPKNLLYESVPISSEKHTKSTLDLPSSAAPVESMKHKTRRKIKNKSSTISNGYDVAKSLIGAGLLSVIVYSLLTDWPIRVPVSESQAVQLGYSEGMGFLLLFSFMLMMLVLSFLCATILSEYTIPKAKKVLMSAKTSAWTKVNNTLDDEYSILQK